MSEPRPILAVKALRKLFPVQKKGRLNREDAFVHAVDGVSLDLQEGEVLALVGESGCGKTTLALTVMNLERPTAGEIFFDGKNVTHLRGRPLRRFRQQIQMIFQDPYESLNPTMTVGAIVAEPLKIHRRSNRQEKVKRALEDAGLRPAEDFLNRYPHELSGGQRQRVVIAGALVLEPKVLIADEPVSMLDVSIRAEILNVLAELRETRGISILFITHDLGTVAHFADRIAVMYLGQIVEQGETAEVLRRPEHPYTKALLSVIPVPNPRLRRERIILQGEIPNPIDLPSGCRFHPRCPIAQPHCQVEPPDLEALSNVQAVACHEAPKPA